MLSVGSVAMPAPVDSGRAVRRDSQSVVKPVVSFFGSAFRPVRRKRVNCRPDSSAVVNISS